MVFSSATFLFMFLPITVAAYYIIGGLLTDSYAVKNTILLIASLVFYAWGEPVYVLLMVYSTLLDYVCGQMIEKNGFKQALFICAADDPMDKNNETVNIIFNADKRDVKQISSWKNAQIVRKDDGLYCLQVKSKAGILLYDEMGK